MERLEAFSTRYAKRREDLDAEVERLRAERDEEIRVAAAAGIPARDIGEMLGLSYQRVSRIVRTPLR